MAKPILWAVNIQGPDDLIAVPDYETAMGVANAFNSWWAGHIAKTGLHEYDPRMWATPIEWPHDADSHAASIANPPADYAEFMSAAGEGE